ncbi:MAG: sugar ABC transporter permease [Faecalicatena sp.]|nr:sugar ABC transporter permease [Faecalicatena sp.]MCI6466197.1 sugar ABC transporter permease [Faecalicatena sp.]MDY5619363.1 sugar ABC transporter permease [Lachnospiraceae bacterium]
MKKTKSMSRNKKIRDVASYVTLTVLSVIWLIPIFWVVMTSFREEGGSYTSYFFPKGLTLANYVNLLTDNSQFYFLKWFGNTLFVAVFSCLLSTFFVLSVSYVMSRMRFKMRKPMMNVALILGMFPSFMSMIAVYYILKGLGITQSLVALIMVYSGGAGLGFFIAKGFFDTLPKSLDEAAYLDGATKFQIFRKITLPLSKPIIVYTVLTSFMAPWMDFIFASVIMGDNYDNYTVALGLFKMLEREFINDYYTQFAAGCVLISIPIAALFISMQKYYVEGVSGGAVKG